MVRSVRAGKTGRGSSPHSRWACSSACGP